MKKGTNPDKKKRTFIAIHVPAERKLLNFYEYLRSSLKDEKIRWVNSYNLHITLRFLGDTEVSVIDEISENLKLAARNYNGFHLNLEGIGVFRSITYPRVLWLGIKNTGALIQLKKGIDLQIYEYLEEDSNKEFSPHLTLGRMKRIEFRKRFSDLVSEFSGEKIAEFPVREFIYYESILSQKGAIYKAISVHKLE